MELLAYLSSSGRIGTEDVAFILSPGEQSPAFLTLDSPLPQATDRFQIEYIKKAIEQCKGNMSEAAERLRLIAPTTPAKCASLGCKSISNQANEDGAQLTWSCCRAISLPLPSGSRLRRAPQ